MLKLQTCASGEDKDGVGFGSTIVLTSCKSATPSGYATNNKDCNDNNSAVNPNGIDNSANGIDEDCSGTDFIVSTNDEYSKLITISPNPANDYITISTPENIEISSQIINQQGQLIMNAGASRSINVSDFISGVYIVKINVSNNLQTVYRTFVKR